MDATFGSDCNFRMGYLTKQSAAWAVLVRAASSVGFAHWIAHYTLGLVSVLLRGMGIHTV
jgi:hypothetical protein